MTPGMHRGPGASATAIAGSLALLGGPLGCGGAMAGAGLNPVHADLASLVGGGARTSFESRGDRASARPLDKDAAYEPTSRKALTPALFWTGVIVGAVGSAATIAFGATGYATEREIERSYERGASRSDIADLEQRGDTMNALTVTGATFGVLGWGLALATYGVDYSRCGPLAPKRRGCGTARGTDEGSRPVDEAARGDTVEAIPDARPVPGESAGEPSAPAAPGSVEGPAAAAAPPG